MTDQVYVPGILDHDGKPLPTAGAEYAMRCIHCGLPSIQPPAFLCPQCSERVTRRLRCFVLFGHWPETA